MFKQKSNNMEFTNEDSKELERRQVEYDSKYIEILVTYHDGFVKSFSPSDWAIFEEKVTKIATEIEYVLIDPLPKPEMKKWWKSVVNIGCIFLVGIILALVTWVLTLIF